MKIHNEGRSNTYNSGSTSYNEFDTGNVVEDSANQVIMDTTVSQENLADIHPFLLDIVGEGNETHPILVEQVLSQVIAVSIGFFGTAAISPSNPTIARNNKFQAKLLTVASTTSLGAIAAWTNSKIVLSIISQNSRHHSNHRVQQHYYKKLQIGLAIIGGMLATVPSALISYYFHGSLLSTVTVLVANSGPNIYPLLSFDKESLRIFQNSLARKIHRLKNKMIHAIQETKSNLLLCDDSMMSFKRKASTILQFYEGNRLFSMQEVKQIFSLCMNDLQDQNNLTPKWEKTALNIVSITSGTFFSLVDAYLNWHVVSEGLSLLTDAPLIRYPLTALITGIAFKFTFPVVRSASTPICNGIYNIFKGHPKKILTFVDRSYPRISLVLKMISIAVAALSFGPPTEASLRYFSGDTRTFMNIAESATLGIISAYVYLSCIEDFISFLIRLKGTGKDREALIIADKLSRFIEYLKKSTVIDIAKILNFIPDELYCRLVENLEINRSQIQEILQSTPMSNNMNFRENYV